MLGLSGGEGVVIVTKLPLLSPDPQVVGWATVACEVCGRPVTVAITAWIAPDDDDPETTVFHTDIDLTDHETHLSIHELEDTWALDPADAEG